MSRRQFDNRVHKHELGMLILGDGKRLVVNLRPGVPFNAVVEQFRNGSLRCWASHAFLDDRAASVVRYNAEEASSNSFVWKDNVKQGTRACVKGGRDLFRVELP